MMPKMWSLIIVLIVLIILILVAIVVILGRGSLHHGQFSSKERGK
jgi:hypothetical protein